MLLFNNFINIMQKKYFWGLLFLGSFLSLVSLFSYGLFWGDDPKKIPSALIGAQAPDFSAVSLFQKEQISLTNFIGKPVVINFFASWCLPCRKEAIELEYVWRQKKNEVYFLAIALNDTEQAAKNFLKEQGVSFLAIRDDDSGSIAINYGVTGIPETFFLNAKGVIMHKIIGSVDREKIISALNINL